jgi:hypothetical protein
MLVATPVPAGSTAQGIRDNQLDLARLIADDFRGFDPAIKPLGN